MAQDPSAYEDQLSVMRTVMEALSRLDESSQESVLTWIDSQFRRHKVPAGSASGAAASESLSRHAVRREGTVSFVAQKMGAKSARDLLLAAAAYLTLFQGKDTFTRDEQISCAKEARGWKADYANQISVNIGRMLDAGTLFERAKNVFGLSDAALADIQQRLAQ